MIKDYSTGKTRFVFYTVTAPDGSFPVKKNRGGINHQTAMYEAKQTDNHMIFSIFDSISEDKYNNAHTVKKIAPAMQNDMDINYSLNDRSVTSKPSVL